jgi:hypothetical protein
MSDRVIITRGTRGETVNGQPRPERVYITGPHFGTDVYSSTEARENASPFRREEAERLLADGYWQHHLPEIEDA